MIPKINIENKLKKYLELGVPPTTFIGSILPVYYEFKNISCCFYDEIILPNLEEHAFEIRMKLTLYVYSDFNISVDHILIPENDETQTLLFYFKDQSKRNEIADLQSYVFSLSKKKIDIYNDSLFIKKLGKILEYPNCCIENCIELRKKKGGSLEANTRDKLYKIENLETEIENINSYFAYEFYPCDPYCKNANKIGNHILSGCKQIDSKLYLATKLYFQYNIIRILDANSTKEELLKVQENYNVSIYQSICKKENLFTKLKNKLKL